MFNNKGGVGKSTLTFHLGHALATLGHRVLLVDFDPQCNLTLYCLSTDEIHDMWKAEDAFIDGFESAKGKLTSAEFEEVNKSPRTVHYLLKPVEEGTAALPSDPPPTNVAENLDLLPGRLTLHQYEAKIGSRWSEAYEGDPLALKTVAWPRTLIDRYIEQNAYDYVLVDTSPSLGALNKVVISSVDGFIVPCLPDMFSLYGIRNIGHALTEWERQFGIIFRNISDEQRRAFPAQLVRFVGFTIYNAKLYTGRTPWNLARAHYNYALQIPATIAGYIPSSFVEHDVSSPIGGQAVMHTHNTYPSHAQKYRMPMWDVPTQPLDPEDRNTVAGNRVRYEATLERYQAFARAVIGRL